MNDIEYIEIMTTNYARYKIFSDNILEFNETGLDKIISKSRNELKKNYKVWLPMVYEKLDKTLPYLVGVDVSNGYEQDNSAVTIVHPYNLNIVAEFKSSLISTTNFKKFLYVLVRKFVPRCILCIERNHNGESIISDLRETLIAPNLYFDNTKKIGPSVDAKLDPKGFLQE